MMDEYTADAFANRDEPVPLLTVNYSDTDTSASEAGKLGKRARLKRSLKEQAQSLKAHHDNKIEGTEGHVSIQDRLFAKLLQQVIPIEAVGSEGETLADKRPFTHVARPAFSLPLMTNNFRRFNARIGIVFVFQNRLIRLFSWRTATHTLSFLAVYTFVCLDPYLLVVVPLVATLLFIMVPAFITRHPHPPPLMTTSATTPYSTNAYSGPALAPARTIKPAAETSKDFFRNMRDLQNCMADFSTMHDALVSVIAPATNFSNEVKSSVLFLYISILTVVLFISAQLLPWRFIILLAGYGLTISGHPTAQTWLIKMQRKTERKAAAMFDPGTVSSQPRHQSLILGITPSQLRSTFEDMSSITLDTAPETHEVEIFELQHRPVRPPASSAVQPVAEWHHHMFTPTPYDPLSPARISRDRPKGTPFFEDVQPPLGWAWRDKKWAMDLEVGEWVQERLIVGVEYDVIDSATVAGPDDTTSSGSRHKEGVFGGWVWDLPPAYGGTRDEEVWLAYGDYDVPSAAAKDKGRDKKDKTHKRNVSSRDWEEGVRWEGSSGRTGEWRRRRWVRVVKRVGVVGDSEKEKR